jgi:uncharacterized protein (TIGR03083 family)
VIEHVDPLRTECERFPSAIEGADPTARVPPCPDWDVRELVVHLGRVQRFWASTVRRGEDADPERPDDSVRPGDGDDLVAWFRAGADDLLAAVEEAPPDRPAWTWWEAPRTAGAIARHQVQEAAVHRWDAEVASGRPGSPLDPPAAADALDEFVDITLVEHPKWTPWPRGRGAIELAPSDARGAGRQVLLGGAGGGSTATLSGTASDLLLVLYRRLPLDAVTVTGDEELAAAFADWLVVD